MLLVEFRQKSKELLSTIYGEKEATSLLDILVQERLGLSNYTHIVEPNYTITNKELSLLGTDIQRLKDNEPLQYILGYTDFCGHRFKVDKNVLIPRPETEILCNKAIEIARQYDFDPNILDICTGSGCIAWTMSFACPNSKIYGIDISEKALALAKNQFQTSVNKPTFIKEDIFLLEEKDLFKEKSIDILLSNPPYILEKEKEKMSSNVLDYEPHIALFTPDESPLLFYEELAKITKKLLSEKGVAIFEINDKLVEQTKDLFSSFSKTDILFDQYDKPRFLVVSQ